MEKVTLSAVIVTETSKALRLDFGELEVWLPKSQVEMTEDTVNKTVEVDIPKWLAKEKGLI